MSAEDRLHQMEERLEWLEKRQDQHLESYKRLLNGFLSVLGGDIERETE